MSTKCGTIPRRRDFERRRALERWDRLEPDSEIPSDLLAILLAAGYITGQDDEWQLTQDGRRAARRLGLK